jgi:predicted GIY-YIG superfamily endonuclease
MHAIYRLVDPRTSETFYVGVAEDVYTRFLQHLRCDGSNPAKDARIQELKAANMMVILETLQLLENAELAFKREGYWIRHFYDLGAPLTNQVMPLAQEYTLAIQPLESKVSPVLIRGMALEEQKAYILALLDMGVTRRKVYTKVDGYIHPVVVDQVFDEQMSLTLSKEMRNEPRLSEQADVAPEEVPAIGPDLRPDDLEMSPLQVQQFKVLYPALGNIVKCLERIDNGRGQGLGKRYHRHASWIVKNELKQNK